MRWGAFETACPRIGALARERFQADELVLLGTIRADGFPRISPCEVDIVGDRILFGMMWQSRKALDLLRDPRLTVHSVPHTRMNPGGDLKLSGLAIDEREPATRDEYREAIRRRIDWAPDEPNFHLFSLDVREAVFIRFGERSVLWRWDEESGFRELLHPDA